MRVCSRPGCPNLVERSGRCPQCAGRADAERRPTGNPYSSRGHQRFRRAVLARDAVCTQHEWPDGDGVECLQLATVADHYPRSRQELADQDLDPNDPSFGRGLCATHHNKRTAQHQPGGWARRLG